MLSGFINVYKPKYLSSATCVNLVKKRLHIKKAGHSGTLDSLAQGVLVVAIGSSTKLIPYLQNSKTYESTFRFGQYSDSLDCGTRMRIDDTPDLSYITPDFIQSKLNQFEGDIMQRVPSYSAVKCNGQRLSDRARRGYVDAPKERVIHIHSIQLTHFHPGIFPEATFKVECKAGTYIRSLCRDLAASLSTKGIVTEIIRTQCHGLSISDSISLEEMRGDSICFLSELQVMSHLPICILHNDPTNPSVEAVFHYKKDLQMQYPNVHMVDSWDWKTVRKAFPTLERNLKNDDYNKDVLLATVEKDASLKILGLGQIQPQFLGNHLIVTVTLERSHLFTWVVC